MNNSELLVRRENYLIVQEYLEYLLNVKNRNSKSVERYRFWLRWLLLWAMEQPLEKADRIKPPFSHYISTLDLAPESQKKVMETVRAFFRWAKMYHDRRFAALPAYWVEDLNPIKVSRGNSIDYVTLEDVLKIVQLPIDGNNLALRRDQAMAALLFLSGARAGAATSLPIQALHLEAQYPFLEQKPLLVCKPRMERAPLRSCTISRNCWKTSVPGMPLSGKTAREGIPGMLPSTNAGANSVWLI